MAQTPDGVPPANEGVCDELMYATPGLYGLCVAFCEAQDCDENFENCNPSSRKLVDIYNKRKRSGDPEMPCLAPPPSCPCWTEEQLAGLQFPAAGDQLACVKDWWWVNSNDPNHGVENHDLWMIQLRTDLNQVVYWTELQTTEVSYHQSNDPYCQIRDLCLDGNCSGLNLAIGPLTPEEFAVCEAQVAQSGAARGFDCFQE